MTININSGCGTNDGDFVIEFEGGNTYKYRTVGGEISGITFGDRKLNLVGKGYFWSPNQNIVLELSYNPNKKGFFSLGKAETPSDYFEGTLKKVTKDFMEEFESKKTKSGPGQKETLQELAKVSGIWTKEILMDNEVVFDIDKARYLKF